MSPAPPLRIAFVLGRFPVVSETFIINQVADLLDRGIDVQVITFSSGVQEHISRRYALHRMWERTHVISPPQSRIRRLAGAVPRVWSLLRDSPRMLIRAVNIFALGSRVFSLRPLYAAAAFAGPRFSVIHCHFGCVAVEFLKLRWDLGLNAPLVTTFYGYDVSQVFRQYPPTYYDALKNEGALFYVMSENMRDRVVAQGFPPGKVEVLPVSIDVPSYPFSERRWLPGQPVELIAVGRFVEKKGFDDLLRALTLVARNATRPIRCTMVGGGPLDETLRRQARDLGLETVVDFKGPMAIEDIVALMAGMHLLVAPSKTASDGDME